ncbi:hypothetical protein NXS19_008802 [Fusarium pseudograminearum]|nr:hypothetical protein NXS19_008802 [Fusarium pseudograminearum]
MPEQCGCAPLVPCSNRRKTPGRPNCSGLSGRSIPSSGVLHKGPTGRLKQFSASSRIALDVLRYPSLSRSWTRRPFVEPFSKHQPPVKPSDTDQPSLSMASVVLS